MAYLRLAAAQLDTVVGDLNGNIERILDALTQAERVGADLCVFPELSITGYPPEDLLLKPRFVADNVAALNEVASATRRCAAIVGFVEPLSADESASTSSPPSSPHRGQLTDGVLANAAAVCAGGRVIDTYRKRLLPNYGVFDEQRWFVPGSGQFRLYRVAGVKVGVSICEDVWFANGPVAQLGQGGAELVVNINASPYSRNRRSERLAMLTGRVKEAGCAIAYVNQVGGQDELVFDGASLVLGADGTLLAAGRQFAEDLVIIDLPIDPATHVDSRVGRPKLRQLEITSTPRNKVPLPPGELEPPLSPEAEVYEALVLGTRDYMLKNRFSDAVIGVSGGIDSSLVATIACDALGPDHVHALAMPSRYSSEGSVFDAMELVRRLGIEAHVVPIDPAHRALAGVLGGVLGEAPSGLTDENLQSRLRGLILMGISNAKGWIVLTTGNKSEMATGYSTLYGDSAGGFAVIKDVPKTLVYELCAYRNTSHRSGPKEPIPQSVLEKPPSAELRPDQRDDQSLPPYEVLDPVLAAYVERDRTPPEMIAEGFDPAVVDQVVRLVDGAEYKRRQMPPGVRITTKAFGKDRRMPITNGYRSEPSVSGARNG